MNVYKFQYGIITEVKSSLKDKCWTTVQGDNVNMTQ